MKKENYILWSKTYTNVHDELQYICFQESIASNSFFNPSLVLIWSSSHTSTCSLTCFTYTQWSICAAPASSAVWFAPALSSDTGTWLWLHWFAAGGAPADGAWRWCTPPPDGCTERDFIYLQYLQRNTKRMWLSLSSSLFNIHRVHALIDSQRDHRQVFGTRGCFHRSSWRLSGFLEATAGKIYISCFVLFPSFQSSQSF